MQSQQLTHISLSVWLVLHFFFFKQNKKKTFFFVCFVLKSPILSFYFKFGKRNCQSNDSFPLVSGSSKGIIFKL